MIGEINTKPQAGELNIQGLIEQYEVYAGNHINAGDFVKYINQFNRSKTTTIKSTYGRSRGNQCAVQLEENKVFLMYSVLTVSGNYAYYYPYAVVCTVENSTITVGTEVQLATPQLEDSGSYVLSTVKISDNNVLTAFGYGTYETPTIGLVACTINGTTITAGSMTRLGNAGNAEDFSMGHYYNGTYNYVFIVGTGRNTTTTPKLIGNIVRVSGTTISVRTTEVQLDIGDSSTSIGPAVSVLKLNGARFFVAYSKGSGNLYGIVCTLSGDTINKGTATALSTDVYSYANSISTSYIRFNSSSNNDYLFLIFLPKNYGAYKEYIHCKVLYSNGNNIYGYCSTDFKSVKNTSTTYQCISALTISNEDNNAKFLVAYATGSGSSNTVYGMFIYFKNSSLSLETNNTLYGRGECSLALINDSNIFLLSHNSSGYILGSINKTVPLIGISTVSSSSDEIFGVSQQNGNGGQDINIYRPYTS